MPFGPCLFKFNHRDFIKKKCNIKFITRILRFINLNFCFSKIIFLVLFLIMGTASQRLEGEGFANSEKEAHRWRARV